MRKHLTEGELRAALDGELNDEQREHLEACADCQARQLHVETELQKIARPLAFLAQAEEPVPAADNAWRRFSRKVIMKKETSMFKKWFASPLIRFGTSAALILALVLAFPGTRALAGELLRLFRVQQVTVVPVDLTGMEQLNGAVGDNISQLISESVTMQKKPSDPVNVASADEASQLAGFDVRVPQALQPSRISVMSGAAFTFTIDRAKAQALLDEAGRSDLVLPQDVDGADVSVNIPSSVSLAFGTCPEPSNEGEAQREQKRESSGSGSPGRMYADCIIFAQIPSPQVEAPQSLDINKLAQIGLEFTGMTPEEAANFTSTVDWTSTLVVPVPRNAATNQQVSVDGVTGTLIERPTDDAPQFALFWVKDGMVYTIGGLGANSQKALEIANSLQ